MARKGKIKDKNGNLSHFRKKVRIEEIAVPDDYYYYWVKQKVHLDCFGHPYENPETPKPYYQNQL